MNFVSNMRIGARLGMGFGIVILLLIAMAAIGIKQVNAVDQSTEIVLHDRYKNLSLAQVLENEVNRQSRALRTALIATEPEIVKGELAKMARWGNMWVVIDGYWPATRIFQQIRYRACHGQGTCPQDKHVYSRYAVRDLPTAPLHEAFGLTR
jgi:hypothetical protein